MSHRTFLIHKLSFHTLIWLSKFILTVSSLDENVTGCCEKSTIKVYYEELCLRKIFLIQNFVVNVIHIIVILYFYVL